jgi:hypothetical protein
VRAPYLGVNGALGRAVRAVARVAAEFVGLGWRSGSSWGGALGRTVEPQAVKAGAQRVGAEPSRRRTRPRHR